MRRLLTFILLLAFLLEPSGAALHGLAAQPSARETEPHSDPSRPRYTITDLGVLGGDTSQGYGINDKGQVVGLTKVNVSTPEGPPYHAFIWASGVMTDLGALGGLQSIAVDINDAGHVVGQAQNSDGRWRAFLWQNGVMQNLGTLGGRQSFALGINTSGQIAGGAEIVDNSDPEDPYYWMRAFRWQNGSMQNLGTLGALSNWSRAYDINDAGQVVGHAALDGDGAHAVIWSGGSIQDLQTLGGTNSYAYGINSAGQVVGASDVASSSHAFLWEGGAMQDLGTLGGQNSTAWDINDAGIVVGESRTASQTQRAVIWEGDQIKDLNTLIPANAGWVLASAQAINKRGQITGWGGVNGQVHAFLLTPVAYYWDNAAGGSWHEATNWDPQGIPGEGDTTIFALAGEYTVDAAAPPTAAQLAAADHPVERMVISGTGTVNLNNLDFALASDTPTEPALEVSHGGTANVNSGAATFTHAVVGGQDPQDPENSPTARLQVFNQDTSLSGSGRLTVGDKGAGDLFVANGGHLTSAESRLGGTRAGTAVVGGDGSLWETGSIAVGFGVSGTLTIEDGARVDSQTAVVGFGPFSDLSQVEVDGKAPGGAESLWTVEQNLTIGEGGSGEVVVRKGAQLVVNQNVFIKQGALNVWHAPVSGVGSRFYVLGNLVVGGNPDLGGVLQLDDGAEGEVGGNFVVGQGGQGVVVIGGDPVAAHISSLKVTNTGAGLCAFGRSHEAIVGISMESIVTCRIVEIGQVGTNAPGRVDLDDSTLFALDFVRVGNVGSGPALVQMASSYLSAARLRGGDGVYIAPTGVVSGTGVVVAGGAGLVNEGAIHPGIAVVSNVQATSTGQAQAAAASLAVTGTLTLSPTARLEIPITGSAAGLYGRLAVTGTAALDGLLVLDFHGYAPAKGDKFTFLTATGGVAGSFDKVEIHGLEPGFQYKVNETGGQMTLEALNDGVALSMGRALLPLVKR